MLEYVVDRVYAVEIERGEDGKKYRPSGAKNAHMALTAHCNLRARDGWRLVAAAEGRVFFERGSE